MFRRFCQSKSYQRRRSTLILLGVAVLCYICVDFNVIAKKWKQTNKDLTNESVESVVSKTNVNQYTHDTVKPEPHPCDTLNCVIIVGYFRGGTTMTLDVLSKSDNNFYVFEPIAFLSEDSYKNLPVKFLNNRTQVFSSTELPKVQAKMLDNWLTCQFTQINLSDLKSSHLHFHSKATRSYYSCQRRLKHNILPCIMELEQACMAKNSRILKVVRLRMQTTHLLLKRIPNLKIIYLVRDPRAIMQSLLSSKLTGRDQLVEKTTEICQNMEQDVTNTKLLKEKYRRNIFMLKYEALTLEPVKIFKQIYQFANLTFSPSVNSFINMSLLGVNMKKQNAFLTKSGNGVKIANNWRNVMTEYDMSIVDKICGDVYKILGYKKVDETVLRNMGESLQVEPLAKNVMNVN